MDFEISSDQEMLRDTVRRWVQNNYSFDQYIATVKDGGFSQDHWTGLTELGLTGIAIPEECGGLGLGPVEAMIVAEELGRGMVCEPWANVCLAATAILRDNTTREISAPWLEKIAAGEAKVVLAVAERHSRFALSNCETIAKQSANGWEITGTKSLVAIGELADAWIIPARTTTANGEQISLFILTNHQDSKTNANVSTRSYVLQDGSRAAELELKDASATMICQDGLAALARAVDILRAAGCSHAVGAMDVSMALTVDYLNTRKQFGVAIGTFQALRHKLADMKMQVELARSMSYLANLRLTSSDEERRYAVAAAKYQVGRSAQWVGEQAVQLHGGIGVTSEYSIAHLFKYLISFELNLGDGYSMLGYISDQMTDGAGVFQ